MKIFQYFKHKFDNNNIDFIFSSNFLNNQNYVSKSSIKVNPLDIGEYLLTTLKGYNNRIYYRLLYILLVIFTFLTTIYLITENTAIIIILLLVVVLSSYPFVLFFSFVKDENETNKVKSFCVSPMNNKYIFMDNIFYKKIINKNEV